MTPVKNADLSEILDQLEDEMLNKIRTKQDYEVLQNVLDSGQVVTTPIIEKILDLCVHDMGTTYTTYVIKTISLIINKVKAGEVLPSPNLVPSAFAFILFLKNMEVSKNNYHSSLKTLLFETLLSYPDETLITITTNHMDDVREVYNRHYFAGLNQDNKMLDFLVRILKILPSEQRTIFVTKNLDMWFSQVIPILLVIEEEGTQNLKHIETLELLAEEFQHVDYANNSVWQGFLKWINDPKRYPLLLQNLLTSGREYWYRLWIVFIKLVKNQITSRNSHGSSINALLPVVENAFKMDVKNRVRAFLCWDALIDNFKMETNEFFLSKRIKLLLIPLYSNNAKVEETAIAKFNTWWHFIVEFQNRIDDSIEAILMSFLRFCFGKSVSPKLPCVPGLISNETKRLSVLALIEIAGHLACSGCCSIPSLSKKFMSTNILVDNWNNFSYALQKSIVISANESAGVTMIHLQCLWKSFVLTVGELAANNVRKDIFEELLSLLEKSIQDKDVCELNTDKNILGNNILELIYSMFSDRDLKIDLLLKTEGDTGPMFKVLSIILGPISNQLYNSDNTQKSIGKLKPLTNFIMCESLCSTSHIVDWLLTNLSPNNSTLVLWTALAESIYENATTAVTLNFEGVLLWPLQNIDKFTDVKFASSAWYSLYSFGYARIKNKNKEIYDVIKTVEVTDTNSTFLMSALTIILKNKLFNESVNNCLGELESLMAVVQKIQKYESIVKEFPVLVDLLLLLMNKIKDISINLIAQNAISITIMSLKLLATSYKLPVNNTNNLSVFVKDLHNAIDDIYKSKHYKKLKQNIIEQLMEYLSISNKQYPLRSDVISMLNKYLADIKDTDSSFYTLVKNKFDNLESNVANKTKKVNIDEENKFTTPVTRKAKKKEANILNTVVENGEEYVVVKSNWKFNPRKLTENQKEKLQRKREDIPALYQDLSQSQDEFKLTTWKTDSQDTSTTTTNSSKSNTKSTEEVTSILKNIRSSEVVPKILENILSENRKSTEVLTDLNKVSVEDNTVKVNSTVNTAKSPRIALKDRVFRNVRNLIEKSQLHKDNKEISESFMQVDNIPKTPITEIKSAPVLTNSAPPNISIERPSRVKRKPKKFDDTELFALKKRRNSYNQVGSQQDHGAISTEDEIILKESCTKNNVTKENNTQHQINKETPVDEPNKVTNKNHIRNTSIESNKADQENIIDSSQDTNIPEVVTQNEQEIAKVNECKQITEKEAPVVIVSKVPKEQHIHDDFKECISDKNIAMTPKSVMKKGSQENVTKKNSVKKSRIEKELAIDMVEGHPYLKTQSEKRLTRKKISESANSSRRKSLTEKLNKSKVELKNTTKLDKKGKEKNKAQLDFVSSKTVDSQESKSTDSIEDLPCSEDIIESSQDSTVTTISVKSVKPVLHKVSVLIENLHIETKYLSDTQNLIVKSKSVDNLTITNQSKDDIDFSQNKTAIEEEKENLTEILDTEPIDSDNRNKTSHSDIVIDVQNKIDLTENMDTEPINATSEVFSHSILGVDNGKDKDLTANMDTQPFDDKNTDDLIIINDEEQPIMIHSGNSCIVGPETQDLAECDTQPNSDSFMDLKDSDLSDITKERNENKNKSDDKNTLEKSKHDISLIAKGQCIETMPDIIDISETNENVNGVCSPFKDEDRRNKDFLDNTFEISPIKAMSPVRGKKSPSPETSSDFVVIKLSSPVHCNGEPFEKFDSPEIFTEDKVSPDKRDQSPPREELSINNNNNNTSPSSTLSLKKNRPQVRTGGRAAQMLGLCVPDRKQTVTNVERSDVEEPKRSTPNTQARRNLRILYNSVGDNSENSEENEDSEKFLKFKRSVPTADCSPSGPILKRKLVDITDEATISPVSKRKRVSFHDPPVSTTMSVQKYIEPGVIRSPQNSATKRHEKQLRSYANMKSPKRLDSVFKLDTVLTRAVESFSDTEQNLTSDDTQGVSLDETPIVEVVKTSDLNDSDPICPELVDCVDPIDVIASELSSPVMKVMFLKEMEGKIVTIGDLAKMTELEVNRLCIKAPKVKIATKVLNDYLSKKAAVIQEKENVPTEVIEIKTIPEIKTMEVEVQTNNVVFMDTEVQTNTTEYILADTQTDKVMTTNCFVQTEESGSNSTKQVINTCVAERPDFVEKLGAHLGGESKRQIAESLSFEDLSGCLMKKVTGANVDTLLNQVLNCATDSNGRTGQLSYLQNYLCNRFECNDLILFCSQLLQKIHEKRI